MAKTIHSRGKGTGEVDLIMQEDGSLTVSTEQLLANTTIDGDNLTITSLTSTSGSLTDNHDGTWTFIPPQDFNGELRLQFSVSDSTVSVSQNVIIDVEAVNDAPAVPEVNFNMLDDGILRFSDTDLLGNASDVDGDELSITNVSSPLGNIVNNGDGTWSFETPLNFNGPIDLNFTVTDGHTFVDQVANVNVQAITNAPVVTTIDLAVNEDNTININENDLLAYASDIDGDNLNVTQITAPQGTLINNNAGTWTFTPVPDFNGNLDLTFTVSDGFASVDQQIQLNVVSVNDAPIAAPVSFSTSEDAAITFTAIDLIGSNYDVDFNNLSVINVVADHGTVVSNGDGTWTFTPDPNYHGSAHLSYLPKFSNS